MCVKGEGDLVRHLSFLGYTLSHVQKPLDEKEFLVKNLATDLRDGLVLGRLLETFEHSSSVVPVCVFFFFSLSSPQMSHSSPALRHLIEHEIPRPDER